MTKLVWDKTGDRIFETGVDRGVLYLEDGSGVAWNGLTSIKEEMVDDSTESVYIDGLKVRDIPNIGSYGATISAITYPDEFLVYEGFYILEEGLYIDDQPAKFFGLSYRTMIGNDLDGVDHGYKIHILYKLMASNDDNAYETMTNQTNPVEFSWKVDAVPTQLPGYRPTAHIWLDTTRMQPETIELIEEILYGTDTVAPRLPSMQELYDFLLNPNKLYVTDKGNGIFEITGPERLVISNSSTSWTVNEINATYLDDVTYTASSTVA